MRRWTYRWRLRPGTIDTPGRRTAAGMVGDNDAAGRFWTRRRAELISHRVLGGLVLSEMSEPVEQRVWGHLDVEIVRPDPSVEWGMLHEHECPPADVPRETP